jgi:hypothetical protein
MFPQEHSKLTRIELLFKLWDYEFANTLNNLTRKERRYLTHLRSLVAALGAPSASPGQQPGTSPQPQADPPPWA